MSMTAGLLSCCGILNPPGTGVFIYPRKVYYYPHTGKVMVKKLRDIHNNTIFDREKDYGSRLQKTSVVVGGGEVKLFG